MREFERQIAADFDAGLIRAPVHLAGGNEEILIDIFRDIRPNDWVLTQWRSHFHALLKGVPPQQLRADIRAGRSISLCYPEYRILSSAIVGGVLPIAVGIALSIKRRRDAIHGKVVERDVLVRPASEEPQVWCFVGDMTAQTGMWSECVKYASYHGLPVQFVVENNGKSVCTDTAEAWGLDNNPSVLTRFYQYDLPYPHSGAGTHVRF